MLPDVNSSNRAASVNHFNGTDLDDIDDFIPRKLPVKLCADCERLFEHKSWSWERHEYYHEMPDPYHQVLPESLPRPRIRPIDFYERTPWELEHGCKLCSLLISQVKWDINYGETYMSTEPKFLDITQVDHFRWGVRLYDNGFIELWLGYKFHDPEQSWSTGHLVTLVPVTEVGWYARSSSPASADPPVVQPPAADSERSFQLMRGWLEDCRSHELCQCKIGTQKRLPTRLIHVTKLPGEFEDIKIQANLCQGADLPNDTPYATLSHCWGKFKFLTLTEGNLDQMTRDIPVAQLSQVFQDAMRVTLELGLSYLWIDSLCIIQDCKNLEDWKREAPRMGDVYGQATLGIAATGFDDGQAGLFRRPCTLSQKHSMLCVPVNWELEKVLPKLSTIKCGLFAFTDFTSMKGLFPYKQPMAVIDCSPLYKRGWTLQERVLSSRMIHFCAGQIIWECEKLVAGETFPANYIPSGSPIEEWRSDGKVTGALWSIRALVLSSDNQVHYFWRRFVQFFSQGELTVADDRVPAVVGIAQILGRITGDQYVFGCWLQDIHRNLLWSSHREPGSRGPSMSISKQRRAPSWSWVSVDGGVSFSWHHRRVMAFSEVKFSTLYREGGSEPDCAGLIASSATGLIVEGPLYTIQHRIWTGAVLSEDEIEMYYGPCYRYDPYHGFDIHIDAAKFQKPTGPDVHQQQFLKWASPTHLLPLTRSELGVQGLLMVEDPEKDNVFIRVGCFERRFPLKSDEDEEDEVDFEVQLRAIVGGDGVDRDPQVLSQAGLCFLGTRKFLLD